jgi:5-methylcytosine-specific restriction enzyme A
MPTRPPVHRPRGWKPPAQVKRDYDQDRGSAAKRGYDHQWRKLRAAHLAAYPLCAPCEAAGRVTEATAVTHIKPHNGDRALLLDPANLESRCANCASRHS